MHTGYLLAGVLSNSLLKFSEIFYFMPIFPVMLPYFASDTAFFFIFQSRQLK